MFLLVITVPVILPVITVPVMLVITVPVSH